MDSLARIHSLAGEPQGLSLSNTQLSLEKCRFWTFFFTARLPPFFFLIYLLIMLLQLSHSPPTPLHPAHPPPSHIPPLQFMSIGHTYKFFGFYISYTILTLPLSIFHLSSMLLILCTFPPLSLSHSPIDTPPCDLHLYGSVPVLVVCLVCSCFCFRCGR